MIGALDRRDLKGSSAMAPFYFLQTDEANHEGHAELCQHFNTIRSELKKGGSIII